MADESRFDRPPVCPRCGYDLGGVVRAWTDRCPLEMPCSECGYEMRLSLVMGADRPPKWFIGAHRGWFSGCRRGPGTLLRMMIPGWPWRTLSLASLQRSCGRRTLVIWGVWIILAFSILPMSSILLLEAGYIIKDLRLMFDVQEDTRLMLSEGRKKGIDLDDQYPLIRQVATDATSASYPWTMAGRYSWRRISSLMGIEPSRRGRPVKPPMVLGLASTPSQSTYRVRTHRDLLNPVFESRRLSEGIPLVDLNWAGSRLGNSPWAWRPREPGSIRFLLVAPPVIVSVLVMPLCFLMLPATLRQARVSKRQLGRIWAFSFAAILPVAFVEFLLPSAFFDGAMIESLRKLWYRQMPLAGIMLPAVLLWAWWWGSGRLLRLPRAMLVSAVLVLIANLSTGLVLLPWAEDWFWILGTWVGGP